MTDAATEMPIGRPSSLRNGARSRWTFCALVAEMDQHEREVLESRELGSTQAYQLALTTGLLAAGLGLVAVGAFFALLQCSLYQRAKAAVAIDQQREWLKVTLSSIGDAVIATDNDDRVVLMNPVAASLTGWTQAEAEQQPLANVFHIVDEMTRTKIENPTRRVRTMDLSACTIKRF